MSFFKNEIALLKLAALRPLQAGTTVEPAALLPTILDRVFKGEL